MNKLQYWIELIQVKLFYKTNIKFKYTSYVKGFLKNDNYLKK